MRRGPTKGMWSNRAGLICPSDKLDWVKPSKVKELRNRTGHFLAECREALIVRKGDVDEAQEYLKNKFECLARGVAPAPEQGK